LVGVINDVFVDSVTISARVMDQVDAQRLLLLELANDLEAIDRIVNDDVQPLIVAETLEALNGAEASVDGPTISVFILIALGIVVGAGTAAIMGRQIVNPIVRLTIVAEELGQGDLSVRASAETTTRSATWQIPSIRWPRLASGPRPNVGR